MTTQSKVSTLFQTYYPELSRYLSRKFNLWDGAEDIVQDAFHNILNAEVIEDLENPRAYLYQTARNIAINKIRRQGYQEDYIASLSASEDLTVSHDREIVAQFDVESVKKALMKLSAKDRNTFMLHKIEGKSYKEISADLNVTVSTIEKRMMKVLGVLRKAVDDE